MGRTIGSNAFPCDRIHPLRCGFQAFKQLDHRSVFIVCADKRSQTQETLLRRSLVRRDFIGMMSINDPPLRAPIFVAEPNVNKRGP